VTLNCFFKMGEPTTGVYKPKKPLTAIVYGFIVLLATSSPDMAQENVPKGFGPDTTGTPGLIDSPASALNYYRVVSSAREASKNGQDELAAELYQKALTIDSDDGEVYIALGNALNGLHKYREAAAAYEAARGHGFGDPAANAYQIAVCYALAGDDASTLNWLDQALISRYKERPAIARDEHFARLKNNPRFREIIGTLPDAITERIAGWDYDLDFLVLEIKRLNPAFPNDLPAEFLSREANLKRNLGSMTDQQVAIEIMALFASLHEAHSVMLPFGMRKGVLTGLIPLQLYDFSDGLFVIDASEANRDLIGCQVLEIGGQDVSSLSHAIAPYIGRDNDTFLRFAVPIALMWVDLLKVAGVSISGDSIEFKVRRAGAITSVLVPFIPGPIDPDKIVFKLVAPKHVDVPPPDYLSHLNQNFWVKNLNKNTIYVQMNQMVNEQNKTLQQFAEELHHAIKNMKPQNLILDVRLNNGGDYNLTLPVLKVVFGFEKSRPDARLFVIEGRNTLSAAQNFISTLDQFGGVIFVGEPSGSKPNHVGDDTLVTLPYSGISGSVPCALHQTSFRDVRDWIAPSVPVVLSSHEYFSQEDPIMETIMHMQNDSANPTLKAQ
jgi:tetratricopeptide (TPR) repeat protein